MALNLKYVNDNFINLMQTSAQNQEILKDMQAQTDDFMQNFEDNPEIISRWGHYYFCDIDGGRIIFNHKTKNIHKCEVCGKIFESEIFDGVWQYFYRNKAIITALVSAVCFKATGNEKYLNYTKQIISFYADNYTKFKLHKKENDVYDSYETMQWGCGRIMPQGLNESIIGIRVAQAYEIISQDIDEEFKNKIHKWFFEMYRLLKPQVVEIHNISVWANCAIGIMGFVCDDKEMVNFAFEGEFGINNQMAKGVTKDYFWYEGSTHYNYFLLEGVCYLFLFAHLYNYNLNTACKNTIIAMYEAGADFTFDNGYFPNPNDGWPNLNLKTYSYQYHTMARVLGENSKIGNIVKFIENMKAPRTILPLSDAYYCNNETPLEKLLFNIDYNYNNYNEIKRTSKNYPKSNYALLRNKKLNVFLKYGLNAKSHAHPDIMNTEIVYGNMRISRDLSNAGYRSRLCNEWHRKTLAHNTVVCDGEDMPLYEMGKCVSYNDNHIKAKANTYKGVKYTREINIMHDTVQDIFSVESDVLHTFDYVLHIEKEFDISLDAVLQQASLEYTQNGYEHVLETLKLQSPPESLTFTAKSNKLDITITIDTTNKEVFLLKTPDNPVTHTRNTILLREKTKNTSYSVLIKTEDKQ